MTTNQRLIRGTVVLIALTVPAFRGANTAHAQTNSAADAPVRAPELAGADAWLNTEQPLTLEALRGRVVLLDFWTYCCINCMHVLPDLKYLEEKYRDRPFVVVGVHSGKFSQEKDAGNIRQAILRHNISHPVAVDSAYKIWNAYGVQSWPTLVLIDPQGYIVGRLSGEGHRAQLDKAIATLLAQSGTEGTLAQPMKFRLESDAAQPSVLQFPGKVLADAAGQRLFISDTNHHRVLVADLDGNVREAVGTSVAGLRDGPYEKAQFRQPQGLALSADGGTLYVADTENHALRAVDLNNRTVQTLAGSGRQAATISRDSGVGKQTELSSPWDLARVGESLYIAMVGPHQIWVYDLKSKRIRVFAGTGREAATDGASEGAAFAQPSGIATDGKHLYVADAESSSIRRVDAAPHGQTKTIAGSGELFDFGQRDGVGRSARFQHPLGVALSDDGLFVADTFNHLIRRVDVRTGEVTTWLGTGRAELGTPSDIGLYEPGGLSVAGDTLYIADTNHHRILAVGIPTKEVRTLSVTIPESTAR